MEVANVHADLLPDVSNDSVEASKLICSNQAVETLLACDCVVLVPIKCKALDPLLLDDKGSRLFVVSETADFRLIAQRAVRRDDIALEIGASYGVATQMLARRVAKVIALDTSDHALGEARERCAKHDNVMFHQCDVLVDFPRVLDLGAGATVVFVDIGGDRLRDDVLWLLRSLQQELRPRFICVKGRAVWRWVETVSRRQEDDVGESSPLPDLPEYSICCRLRKRSAFDNDRLRKDLETVAGKNVKSRHPLSYPHRSVPSCEGRYICRYQNFLEKGCDKGECCERDHEHCYWCGVVGHRALDCCKSQVRVVPHEVLKGA